MGDIPQVLLEAGFQVAQPALDGHGTKPEDLIGVKWADWYQTALNAYLSLPEPRCIVALSMGTLLGAKLAAEHNPAALVAVAPFLVPQNKIAYLSKYLHPIIPWSKGTNSVRDPNKLASSPNYARFPVKTLAEVVQLQKIATSALPKITAPTLILEAKYDSTSAPSGVKMYFEKISSSKKTYIQIESEHDIFLDNQAETANNLIRDWLQTQLSL